jgi:hypothetical protein
MSRMAIGRVYGPWHHEIWVADLVTDSVAMVVRKSSGAQE